MIDSKTAAARLRGETSSPALAAPWQGLIWDGQSLAAGPIGSVNEKLALNSTDRLGVAMLGGLMATNGQDIEVQGPLGGEYDTSIPTSGITPAMTESYMPMALYISLALRMRRAEYRLPNPSLMTGFNGIPGQAVDQFMTGTLIDRNRAYWMDQVASVLGDVDVPYAGFSQGEADGNAPQGQYRAEAAVMWQQWLDQIEATLGYRPRAVATQIGAYADSDTNKTYHVCTEQVEAVEAIGGLAVASWYPIPVHDNNVHPGDHGSRVMADTIAWVLAEVEAGREPPPLKPTAQITGNQVVLTYPLRPGVQLRFADPSRYAPYGGHCPNYGFEVAGATITGVSLGADGSSVVIDCDAPPSAWSYAYQFQDVTGSSPDGETNYGAHRGLLHTTERAEGLLAAGETLRRWALSWRGEL